MNRGLLILLALILANLLGFGPTICAAAVVLGIALIVIVITLAVVVVPALIAIADVVAVPVAIIAVVFLATEPTELDGESDAKLIEAAAASDPDAKLIQAAAASEPDALEQRRALGVEAERERRTHPALMSGAFEAVGWA
ncbi:hypothetical protein BV22DRAFT_1037434 [Leucogyrophana mollusca]|uniref:Uncharacterized protein n=1 Tax=Leucogyrophana mollusca TaxID=85980 RepID=A0ACB8BC01_9AGAM|nr:hypothetical protein BV22DRAFT_1037434 [Leucogyrophana mollusca]